MPRKVAFIERKLHDSYSLERVFRLIAANLNKEKFEHFFIKMPYLRGFSGMIKNTATFKKPDADIFHITGAVHYIGLFLNVERTVLTIHDLNILQMRTGLRRALLQKILYDLPVRKLKYITAISEATKRELIELTKCAPDKIRVIENPVDESFFSLPTKIFNVECPNILHIGTLPHKNLENLIKAVEGLQCRLTIIGRIDEATKNLLTEKKIRFENRFDLTDEEIKNEYKNADVVAFCSLSEGFGLPIIEAQAAQTPVLTSNIEPMLSIAGNGAVLCEPKNHLSIREGLQKIIEDENFRKSLIEKGSENVRRFHPKKIAARYELLYSEMLSNLN